jgi:hypothetical protein
MKKLLAIAVVAAVGVASSWAGTISTTNILFQQDIIIKGKLTPNGTTVTNACLSGNSDPISFLNLDIISGTTTNDIWAIGQVSTNGSATNVVVLLMEGPYVNLQPKKLNGFKFKTVLMGSVGTASNAMIWISGTENDDENIVSATLGGIWDDSTQSGGWTNGQGIVGTLMPAKKKR